MKSNKSHKYMKRYIFKKRMNKCKEFIKNLDIKKRFFISIFSIINVSITIWLAIIANKISITANEIANDNNQLVQCQINLQEKELEMEEYKSEPQFIIEKTNLDNRLSSFLSCYDGEINLLYLTASSLFDIYNNNLDDFEKIYDLLLKCGYTFNESGHAVDFPGQNLEDTYTIKDKVHWIISILRAYNTQYIVKNYGVNISYFDLITIQYLNVYINNGESNSCFSFPISRFYKFDSEQNNQILFSSPDELYNIYIEDIIKDELDMYFKSDVTTCYLETYFLIQYPSYDYNITQKVYYLKDDRLIDMGINEEEIDDYNFTDGIKGNEILWQYGINNNKLKESIQDAIDFIKSNCQSGK